MPYWIDPLTDSRWTEFIDRHPSSSVFHTTAWLRALQKTYGFGPTAVTASPPGSPLENGIPFCRISSIVTGRRLSSLPFSDHCQPLAEPEEMASLLEEPIENCKRKQLKYLELRPLSFPAPPGLVSSQKFLFHKLDLRPSKDEIFQNLHPNCIRRKIRRADREGLSVEAGTSDALVDAFFTLQVHTRRRHGLPPQPKRWFRNLVAEMNGKATIRVAYHGERPVASILTLRHKKTETYKYGGSEAEDNRLGGMPLLFWQTIENAKADGMEMLDLGRCDLPNRGLALFKERLGGERQEIVYFRYPQKLPEGRSLDIAATVFSKLPYPMLKLAGRILYRHIA